MTLNPNNTLQSHQPSTLEGCATEKHFLHRVPTVQASLTLKTLFSNTQTKPLPSNISYICSRSDLRSGDGFLPLCCWARCVPSMAPLDPTVELDVTGC